MPRIALVGKGSMWEWEDGRNGWKPYDQTSDTALTAALRADTRALTLTILGHTYDLDLATMRQKKQDTGYGTLVCIHFM